VASTLNSLPDGLVFSADSSGALDIQANGVTAIEIGSGASVTLSNPPVLSSPLAVSSGGTGVSAAPTNGQLLIGNGTGFDLSTLTAGSGITIDNNAGSITITNSSTGGAQDFIVQSYGIV